jgi:hypothetical protein
MEAIGTKREVCDLTPCVFVAAVLSGGMKRLDGERKVSTGGSIDDLEDGQVVGKMKRADAAWLLQYLFEIDGLNGSEGQWDVLGTEAEGRPQSKTAGEGNIIVKVKKRRKLRRLPGRNW